MFRDDVTRTIDQLVTRFSLSLPPTLLEGPGFQRMRLHPLERQGGGRDLPARRNRRPVWKGGSSRLGFRVIS